MLPEAPRRAIGESLDKMIANIDGFGCFAGLLGKPRRQLIAVVFIMRAVKRPLLAVVSATVWISASEFFRNNVLLPHLWIEHYHRLGLTFPARPVNGALWGLWSLLFAIAIVVIAQRFSLLQTTLLGWLVAFLMMWVVIGNLGVLPITILWSAVPLSVVETLGATFIAKRVSRTDSTDRPIQGSGGRTPTCSS